MTLPAIAALLFLALAPQTPTLQQPAIPKGSIEGLILHIGTGDPIPGARVTLARVQAPQAALPSVPGAPPPPPQPVASPLAQNNPAVNTDSQGKFIFKDLDPGQYRIQVANNGYARTEYGQRVFGGQGTAVSVVAAQALNNLVIRLTPAGNVSGRIRDIGGQPVVGVQVQLMKASYSGNGQRSYQSAGSVTTNDRGEYRLYWVTPGRYYLNVGSSQGFPVTVGSGGASPNEVRDVYESTYYPNVTDISLATMLDVRPGNEISGIDVVINRQQLYRIRGRVIDARSDRPPQAVSFSTSSRSLTGGGVTMTGGQNQKYNNADGSFELGSMAPGPYVIGAQIGIISPRSQDQPRAQATVIVSNSDVENLELTIFPPMSVPGRLSIEGHALDTLTSLDRLRVQLAPPRDAPNADPGALSYSQSQPVSTDGTFKLDNLVPGDYRVTVSGMPLGYYLKAARLDQTDGIDQPLHVTLSSTGTLDVVLSPKAGQIDGTLVDDKQQIVRGIQAVLMPDRQRNRTDLYKTATSDQNGLFTLRGIPPGDYKLFAWEAIENYGYYDPELIRLYEAKGKLVRVSESSTQTVEIKIIPPVEP